MHANTLSSTIEPWLSVYDGEKAVAFYKQAFSAEEVYRLAVPDGGLVVKLSVNGAAFWISSEPGSDKKEEQQHLGGNSVRMILTVVNPDAVFDQAIQAGATLVFPVGEAHGWRLGRLIDPFGLHWEIGKML